MHRARRCSGPLVRAADGTWDLGVVRTPAVLAGAARRRGRGRRLASAARWRPWRRCVALCVAVDRADRRARRRCSRSGCATRPRRGSTSTTRRTRSSSPATLVRHGHDPYGHDYARLRARALLQPATAPCRRRPSTRRSRCAHFAYFPGTALTAAAWSVLPAPLDDYRLLVLLATLGCFFAVLALRRAAAVAARRRARRSRRARSLVRGAWFGTADAPALLALVLAFALADPLAATSGPRPRSPARDPAEAVRARRACRSSSLMLLARGPPAADARPARPRPSPRVLVAGLPAVPRRRPGRALARHDRLRRRHLPDPRLRALGAAAQRGHHRRPLRLLPVRAPRRCSSGCP